MSLFESASLVVTPNGTKASKLYAIKPTSGAGDLSVTRATTATRVNSAGLIESVAVNVPRLDYTNSTCPSILVEPQRTNLLTYSQQFDNADWIDENVNLTANSIISPSGVLNAYKMTDTSVVDGEFRIQQNKTTTISTPYTATVFLKADASNFAMLRMYGGNLDLYYCVVVNLSNGTITKTQNGGLTSSVSYTITPCVNGWYKLTATSTMVSTNMFHIIHISNSGTPTIGDYGQINYTGTGSNSIYVWGAQLEAGSYATSYIPTTTASVTRNADVISKTGISSLIGQTEGTLFFDIYRPTLNAPFFYIIANSVGIDNYLNSIFIFQNANGNIRSECVVAGVQQFAISTSGVSVGRHKIAIAYKQNDFVFYIDGVQIGTDTSGILPPLSAIEINGVDAGSLSNLSINSAVLFKTRLTNAELAEITSL
jgi:hypothetical protein